jgi:hypothetical protein
MKTTPPSDPSKAPIGGLTRSQVAHQLRIGITTVHRLRVSGQLHPRRDSAGAWRYDPAEVVRLAVVRGVPDARSEGEIAARVFQMLDQGAGLREIVVAVRLVPQEVRRLYADYKTSLYTDLPPRTQNSQPPLPPKTGATGDTGDRRGPPT